MEGRRVAITLHYGQLSILMGKDENLMKKELSSSKGDNLVIWRVFVGDTLELLTFGIYLQIQICQIQVSHQEGKDCGEDTSRTSTSLLSLITAFIILTYISSSFSDQQALNLYVEPSRCSKAFQMNEWKLLQISYCLQREVTMPQRWTKKLGLYLFHYVQSYQQSQESITGACAINRVLMTTFLSAR